MRKCPAACLQQITEQQINSFLKCRTPFKLVKISLEVTKYTDILKKQVSPRSLAETVGRLRPARESSGRTTKLFMPINLLIPLWITYSYIPRKSFKSKKEKSYLYGNVHNTAIPHREKKSKQTTSIPNSTNIFKQLISYSVMDSILLLQIEN